MTPTTIRAAQRFRRRFPADQRDEAEAAYAWAAGHNLTLDELTIRPLGELAVWMRNGTPKGIVPIPTFVMRTLAAMQRQADPAMNEA